jgi:hypothetical protein
LCYPTGPKAQSDMEPKKLAALVAAVLLFIAACQMDVWQAVGGVTGAEVVPALGVSAVPRRTEAGAGYSLAGVSDLSDLESFRLHYTLRWQWSSDVQENADYWDIWAEFVREPLARRLVWESGDAAGVTQELIQLGQDIYTRSALGWTVAAASGKDIFADNPMLSAPLDILSGHRGWLLERDVVVNGVTADYYAFDSANLQMVLGLDSTSTARGEVWISREFNVVVKYVVNVQAQHPYAGAPEAGALCLTFDLMDINEPIHIAAPQGSRPALPEDIPIPEGVTELNALSGIIAYRARQTVNELQSFYKSEMMRHGWAEVQAPAPGALAFAKDGRTAQIMFSLEDDRTAVAIVYDV